MVTSFMNSFSITWRMTATGQGEPAMMPVRRLSNRNFPNNLWSRMAMNMVGTP